MVRRFEAEVAQYTVNVNFWYGHDCYWVLFFGHISPPDDFLLLCLLLWFSFHFRLIVPAFLVISLNVFTVIFPHIFYIPDVRTPPPRFPFSDPCLIISLPSFRNNIYWLSTSRYSPSNTWVSSKIALISPLHHLYPSSLYSPFPSLLTFSRYTCTLHTPGMRILIPGSARHSSLPFHEPWRNSNDLTITFIFLCLI